MIGYKQKKLKLRKLSEAEKGYIAGMIDGEGHLYITSPYEESAFSTIRVRITDECVVEHLRKLTGVGAINSHMPKVRRKDGRKKKRIFEWCLKTRTDVRRLLIDILPYLVLKKRRAKLLLELEGLKDQGAATWEEIERIRRAISVDVAR